MHQDTVSATADSAEWSVEPAWTSYWSDGVDHDFYAMHPVTIGDRNEIGDSKLELGMDVLRLGIDLLGVPNLC
jgi:hypothetical protein